MSVMGIITLIFTTAIYIANVLVYAKLIRDKGKNRFFKKPKLVALVFCIYLFVCLAYWVALTILYNSQGTANQIVVYLIGTIYCLWCIYSMMDMLSLTTKKSPQAIKRTSKVDYLCFAVSIIDAVILLVGMILLLNNIMATQLTQILIEAFYFGLVILSIIFLATFLSMNIFRNRRILRYVNRKN